VPIRIAEIRRATGEPCQDDWNFARSTGQLIAEKGDILLFGGTKKGEAAAIMNAMIEAIAVMAFLPGGITLFGLHFEATA